MKTKVILSLFALSFALFVLSGCSTTPVQLGYVPVFKAGADGYKSYRIPAIVRLPNGNLLAFCEGRVNGWGDFGNIDMVMKTSTNGGRTWSDLKVVADYGSLQLCNPAPVVDMTDPEYPQGRIFFFYNTGIHGEGEIVKGKGIKHCMYKTSADGGLTWSEPVDITMQVHRPRQPTVDAKYNFSEDWRYYANTPGHAMQFLQGKFKGRIFVAANHSAGDPKKGAGHYAAHGYYTDDHGRTFKLGDSLQLAGSNESMAAELSGSRLMMNSRNQRGDVKARIVSISSDGGASWDCTYFDKNLIDPVCQGSILKIGERNGRNILAFCNAADTKKRVNLTLRISNDDGTTWDKSFVVYKEQAAYSDLVGLNDDKVGILFEKDNCAEIAFIAVKWNQ